MTWSMLFVIAICLALFGGGAEGMGLVDGRCMCPRRMAMVCGEDGKDYFNSCLASCENTKVACEGACPCQRLIDPREEESSSSSQNQECRCPRVGMGVCGADGKNYWNECLAKCEGVSVQCQGECPCTNPRLQTTPATTTVSPFLRMIIDMMMKRIEELRNNPQIIVD